MFKPKREPIYSDEYIEQILSTKKLFMERMEVIVPFYAAHTPEKMKLYGVIYNEGSTKEEQDIQNREPVKIWCAPIKHIIMYSEGIPISYPDRVRAAKIYFYIKNHVKTWSELCGGSMHRRGNTPPMEDFDIMLEFAQNLEKFLNFYYDATDTNNFLKRNTMNRFAANEKRFHKDDSVYSMMRDNIFGMLTDRQVRVDDGPIQTSRVDTSNEDFNLNFDNELRSFRDQ